MVTVSANVTSTESIDFYKKKLRYKMNFYILRTVLLKISLLFIIANICYHYGKQVKRKTYQHANDIKMENKELKKVRIKNSTCYFFDDIIKFKDSNFDDILLDEKSYKSILIYDL